MITRTYLNDAGEVVTEEVSPADFYRAAQDEHEAALTAPPSLQEERVARSGSPASARTPSPTKGEPRCAALAGDCLASAAADRGAAKADRVWIRTPRKASSFGSVEPHKLFAPMKPALRVKTMLQEIVARIEARERMDAAGAPLGGRQ